MNTNITLPECPIERKAFKQTEEYSCYKKQKRATRLNRCIEKKRESAKLRRDQSLKEVIASYEGQVKEVPFAPDYYAFDDGRIYSYFSERFMTLCATNDGYKYTGIFFKNGEEKEKKNTRCLVHRTLAQTFIGEIPEGYEVNHKNHVRDDNRLENLEIVTVAVNRSSRRPKPKDYIRPKITEETRKRMSVSQKARFQKSKNVGENC
jgi:hypothetical protein